MGLTKQNVFSRLMQIYQTHPNSDAAKVIADFTRQRKNEQMIPEEQRPAVRAITFGQVDVEFTELVADPTKVPPDVLQESLNYLKTHWDHVPEE